MMMALSSDARYPRIDDDQNELPLLAAVTVYQHALIGVVPSGGNQGHARPLAAGDIFAGLAILPASGGASNGLNSVKIWRRGAIQVPVTGVTIANNVGTPVYASDDNTLTLTASGNSLVGFVRRVVSSGVAIIEFDAGLVRASIFA
jgi:hypothetical protein